jgi:hypothetical protein
MGGRWSRTCLRDVTPKQLTNAAKGKGKASGFVLSPHFCLKVIKKCLPPHYACTGRELEKFARCIVTLENYEKVQKRKEERLWAAMTKPKAASKQVDAEAAVVLSQIYAGRGFFHRPTLLERTLVSQLERIRLSRIKRLGPYGHLISAWRWIFTKAVTTKTLRRSTNYGLVAASPGLERAHLLSLGLATRLWKAHAGHDRIGARDLAALKSALNDRRNLRVVCQHTNRVLHVRYDDEIAMAMEESGLRLSPGARQRLKCAVQVLETLSCDHEKIRPFCDESIKRLKALK